MKKLTSIVTTFAFLLAVSALPSVAHPYDCNPCYSQQEVEDGIEGGVIVGMILGGVIFGVVGFALGHTLAKKSNREYPTSFIQDGYANKGNGGLFYRPNVDFERKKKIGWQFGYKW